MITTPPPFWKTCRVIACETRLRLLWSLFALKEQCVSELMETTGTSRPNTSNQLRMLAEHGLLIYRRESMNVFYRAEPNAAMTFAPPLLNALQNAYTHSMGRKTVIRHATALSHGRREEIIRALKGNRLSFQQLQQKTGMSTSALSRHLHKLTSRSFVQHNNDQTYSYGKLGNLLGRTLIQLAADPGYSMPQ